MQQDLDSGFMLEDRVVEPRRSLVTMPDGEQRRLEPRAMEALVHLAGAGGDVVRRDALLDSVWRTTVGDEVLSRAISLIRHALGDDARSPRFVETIPKVGYRLLAAPAAVDRVPPARTASGDAAHGGAGSAEPAAVPPPAQTTPAPASTPAPATASAAAPAPASTAAATETMTAPTTAAALAPGDGAPEGVRHQRRSAPADRALPPARPGLGPMTLVAAAGLILFVGLGWLFMGNRQPATQPAPAEARASLQALAILPLEDLVIDGEARPLGLGLADTLRAELGRNPALRVLARSSSMAVSREARDARALGEAFGIDAVLEGSVIQNGPVITVHLTLSDARDGYQRWTRTFDGATRDLFEMSRDMVRQLEMELAVAESPQTLTSRPDAAAYTLYLQGLHYFALRGADGLGRAESLFRQALELDPGFDAARVFLAQTLVLQPYWTPLEEDDAFPRALALLDELRSPDQLIRGLSAGVRGFVHFRRWEWDAAREAFDEALALAPQDAGIHAWQSQFLAAMGDLHGALREARESWALDPGSPIVGSRVAIGELWLGNIDAAARYYDTTAPTDLVRRDPSYLIYLLDLGRDAEVAALLTSVHAKAGLRTDWVDACLGLIRHQGDRDAQLQRYTSAIADGQVLPRMQFAIWILAGEYARATAFVDRFRDRRRFVDVEFMFAKQAEAYRADPSFERALEILDHPARGR
ncbi:MAG TPA: winged helix-turn-helix domain-containing protein [Pseudomonadales bacterium]|nr:winged helix-turn-helix domain-containing protein [Pseudomonadales bacterium]